MVWCGLVGVSNEIGYGGENFQEKENSFLELWSDKG
jgi:hypothetical protein